MTSELVLRRKWTLKAHGRQVVFVKKARERGTHVLMKAFLWAIYLPEYPNLTIETPVGDRYRPDLVALGLDGRPIFWGEAGHVGSQKIRSLARRYPHTHLAMAKWDARLGPFAALVAKAVAGLSRTAPFDILNFPPDSAERFIDEGGHIRLTHAELNWQRF